ncbi:hypothetical protein Dimus_013446 [Dionaea muscipula]
MDLGVVFIGIPRALRWCWVNCLGGDRTSAVSDSVRRRRGASGRTAPGHFGVSFTWSYAGLSRTGDCRLRGRFSVGFAAARLLVIPKLLNFLLIVVCFVLNLVLDWRIGVVLVGSWGWSGVVFVRWNRV